LINKTYQVVSFFIKGKDRFISNFLSMTTLQFVGYALPVVVIPYLTRVLGMAGYGKYVFFLALISFFDLIISYGFRVSATDQISKCSDDVDSVSRVFHAVVSAKILLFLSGTILFLPLALYVPQISSGLPVLIAGLPLIIGNIFYPVWLYQGMESMKHVAIADIITKLFFTLMIFVFVSSEADLRLAILIYSTSFLVIGLGTFIFAYFVFGLNFRLPNFAAVLSQLRGGFDVFVTHFLVGMYSKINIVVFGLLYSEVAVAIYALGEKVFRLVSSMAAPFNRAVFPVLSKKYLISKSNYVGAVKKSVAILLSVFSIAGVTVFFGAKTIAILLSGNPDGAIQTAKIIQILSFAIPFFPLGALTTYLLVIQGQSADLRRIAIGVVVLNAVLFYFLALPFGFIGLAIVTLSISITVACVQGLSVYLGLASRPACPGA